MARRGSARHGVNVSGEIRSIDGDLVGRDKITVYGSPGNAPEKEVIYKLLVFLEDRRLLTEEKGYQSHFPDHLRISSQEIRRRANEAIQSLDPSSPLVHVLKRLQSAARKFQAATEGAKDSNPSGGLTPTLPVGWDSFLNSLVEYRNEIAAAIVEAADAYGLEIDPRIRAQRSLLDGTRMPRE